MSDTVYGLYEVAIGVLLSVGTIVADPLPDGTDTPTNGGDISFTFDAEGIIQFSTV